MESVAVNYKMNSATSNQKKPLRIWAVTDNKPGHQNQTMGLIHALSHYRDVDENWMPGVSFAQNIWTSLSKKNGNSSNSQNKIPDLLIGAGHKTHLTLLALRRRFGGRVVIMMSPSLPLNKFDLCFIPRHDKPLKTDNVIETLGPINRIIPATPSFTRRHQHQQLPQRKLETGLILIGGPSRHFLWDSLFVAQLVGSLVAQYHDTQWVIVGSRRTPCECYDALKQYSPDINIVYPDDVSSDWLPEKIHEAGKIWVTEDSISMVYESLTSGAQTGIIRLAYDKETRVTKEIDCLIFEGRVHTTSAKTMIKIHKKEPAVLYEADRCAKLLLQKFNL